MQHERYKKDKNGNIFTRTTLIQYCINRFKYKSYLEIGYGIGPHAGENWKQIICQDKICVDIDESLSSKKIENLLIMSSDDFFVQNKEKKFDIIFIDGWHNPYQVYKDILNSLDIISDNGIIILHDCNPPIKYAEREDYCDKAWRVIPKLRSHENIDLITIDSDLGLGVLKKRKNKNILLAETESDQSLKNFLLSEPINFDLISFSMLSADRQKMVNLKSIEDGLEWIDNI